MATLALRGAPDPLPRYVGRVRSLSRALLWVVLFSVAACGGKQLPTASPFAGRVLGFVVDEDGLAIIGATVRLTPDLGDEYAEVEESVRGGRFHFEDVPPGEARVDVSASGYFGSMVTVIVPGTKSATCTVQMERTRAISGRVVFGDAGIEGATIVARPEDGGARETGWSDKGGSFLVGGLRKGSHTLALHVPPMVRLVDGSYLAVADMSAEAGTDGKPVLFDLPGGGGLDVETDANGWVSLESEMLPARRYPVEETGKIAWRGLPPGTYRVTLHAERGFKKTLDVSIEFGKTASLVLHKPPEPKKEDEPTDEPAGCDADEEG